MRKYEIIIFWSDEDQAYVADVPELPGCMAHGSSYEQALSSAQEAIDLWLDAARDLGRAVPEPKGRRLQYAQPQATSNKPLQRTATRGTRCAAHPPTHPAQRRAASHLRRDRRGR